jgi:hypothetical protein
MRASSNQTILARGRGGIITANELLGEANVASVGRSVASSAVRAAVGGSQQLRAQNERVGGSLQQQLLVADRAHAAAGPTASATIMSVTMSAVSLRISSI